MFLRMEPRIKSRLAAAACILGGSAAAGSWGAAFAHGPYAQPTRGERLVLVELYTSQGCSSCPPADEVQSELARRAGILPLTFPVDYWDYLGWRDTLASPANAKRQMAYAARSRNPGVFTPQMVIDGVFSANGTQRENVFSQVRVRMAADGFAVPIRVTVANDTVSVSIPGDPQYNVHSKTNASVWLFPFSKFNTVHIGDGENRGRSMRYTHVVRDVELLGRWSGEPANFEYALPPRERGQFGYAVVLQEAGNGPVIASAWAANQEQIAPLSAPQAPPLVPDAMLINIVR